MVRAGGGVDDLLPLGCIGDSCMRKGAFVLGCGDTGKGGRSSPLEATPNKQKHRSQNSGSKGQMRGWGWDFGGPHSSL